MGSMWGLGGRLIPVLVAFLAVACLLWATHEASARQGGTVTSATRVDLAQAQSVPSPTHHAQASPTPPPAQGSTPRPPFGMTPAGGPGAGSAKSPAADAGMLSRLTAWVQVKQAEYHRALIQAMRAMRAEGALAAGLGLTLLSFLYGVFHAVGPGHGKAVISSYVLANERTARRGVLVAFISSFFQALSAILIVGVMAIALRATSRQIQAFESTIEQVSFALVALIGAWMLYRQVRALVTGMPDHHHGHHHGHREHHDHAHDHSHGRHHGHGHGQHGGVAAARAPALAGSPSDGTASAHSAASFAHGETHAHHRHGHAHHDHHHHAHDTDQVCDHCGHSHLPGPAELDGAWSWRRALALSLAVGIRPCTGAILVLVFALSQGMLAAGIAATLAMSLGTAITVSLLAVLAVKSKDLATRLAGGDGRWSARIHAAAGILGSLAMMAFGIVFLLAALGPQRPF